MIKFGLSLKEKVYYAAGKYLPFLKIPPPTMDRQGAMTLRPAHNTKLKWEKQDSGETIITVPQNDLDIEVIQNISLDEEDNMVLHFLK